MEFYSRLLLQITEATRYIQDGRLEHLRLALLLLDNAAEMQLAKYVETAFVYERWNERLKEQWQQMAHLGNLPDAARKCLAFESLTQREKQSITRNFEDKIRYACTRKKMLPDHLASPLIHLHQYRNEAYHRNYIRPETIRAACLILLEIVCQMALLIPSSSGLSSDDDLSWLEERFGITRRDLFGQWLPTAIEQIRTPIVRDASELNSILASYMTDRLANFHSDLASMAKNLSCVATEKDALRATFEFRSDTIKQARDGLTKRPLESRTLDWINGLRERIPPIAEAATMVEGFQRFAELERDFEPIETALAEFTFEVDAYIDLQGDIARGK